MSATNRIATLGCGLIVGSAATWLLARRRLESVEAQRDDQFPLHNLVQRLGEGESERDQLRREAVERFDRLEELQAAADALVEALSDPDSSGDNVSIAQQRVIDASRSLGGADHVSELASDLVGVGSLRDLEGARSILDQLLATN